MMPDTATPVRHIVSVVIPTFNGGDWLLDTLASCFDQGPLSLEVIVVDDASTDDTPDRIAAAYPQVHLIRQSANSGSGAHGRNTGLEQATARYVKFLDHDDLLEPNTLLLEVQAAEASAADMVISRWGDVRTTDTGQLLESSRRVFIPPAPERLVDAILRGEKVPYTAGVLYRRSFIAHQRWDARLTINDDFDWFCRNALRTERIVRLDHVSYYWRLHPGSIQGSQRFNPKSFVESVLIHNHIYRMIAATLKQQQRLTPVFRHLLARQLCRDLRVLSRFSPGRCWLTINCIRDLKPNFRADESLDKSSLFRLLCNSLGLKPALRLYRWFLWLPDQIRFRGGRVRFFQM